jgi:hypothetical protein
MTASASIEMTGLKEAIRSLNKIEPGLRKEFTRNANEIAAPAIQEVQKGYAKFRCRVWLATGQTNQDAKSSHSLSLRHSLG